MARRSTILLGGALALLAAGAARASTPPSRYQPAVCPPEVATGEGIECGLLTVPENRHAAQTRAIRLPVIIMRGRAASPAKDPLVFLTGGPGVSGTSGRKSAKGNPFLDERDQVVLEVRGGRRAEPALECPEYVQANVSIATGDIAGSAAPNALVAAAKACRDRLTAAGADLDGYTSAETADDIEDLRVALGYDKLNLYGLSYGARLALTVLRRHPDSIRSVVLDSVLPPEVNFDEMAGANLRRALNAAFDACAVDPACARAHPKLPEHFAAVLARADRTPLRIAPTKAGETPMRATGADVAGALASALEDVDAIPTVPRLVDEAFAGRYDLLAPLVAGNRKPSSFTWGLRLSIWCGEEAPFEDPAVVAAQVAPAFGLAGADPRTTSLEVCKAWNVAAAAPIENQPVRSDVPTLIFAGEFDPDTPPDWGRRLLANMPKATFVLMPGRSHGASFNGCAGRMVVAFVRDPAKSPSLDCVATRRGADFGVSADVPPRRP